MTTSRFSVVFLITVASLSETSQAVEFGFGKLGKFDGFGGGPSGFGGGDFGSHLGNIGQDVNSRLDNFNSFGFKGKGFGGGADKKQGGFGPVNVNDYFGNDQ